MLDRQSLKFREFLIRMRKEKQQSQEELAFNSKRDRKSISNLERDESQPSLITFIQIAFALNMKPSELMKEFEERTGLQEIYHEEDDDSKDT